MTRRKSRKPSRRALTTIHAYAGGIDIGATFHVVAVPPGRDKEPVRTFRSFTGDLHELADFAQRGWDHHHRHGIHRGVLDSGLRDLGSARV